MDINERIAQHKAKVDEVVNEIRVLEVHLSKSIRELDMKEARKYAHQLELARNKRDRLIGDEPE